MRSLDTDVIIRFLVNDDKTQGNRARILFQDAEKHGESFFITSLVILETLWVLRSVYDFDRHDILIAIESLFHMPILEFENPDMIQKFIHQGRSTPLELDDLLIGVNAKSCGCDSTLTFDRGASASVLFKLLK